MSSQPNENQAKTTPVKSSPSTSSTFASSFFDRLSPSLTRNSSRNSLPTLPMQPADYSNADEKSASTTNTPNKSTKSKKKKQPTSDWKTALKSVQSGLSSGELLIPSPKKVTHVHVHVHECEQGEDLDLNEGREIRRQSVNDGNNKSYVYYSNNSDDDSIKRYKKRINGVSPSFNTSGNSNSSLSNANSNDTFTDVNLNDTVSPIKPPQVQRVSLTNANEIESESGAVIGNGIDSDCSANTYASANATNRSSQQLNNFNSRIDVDDYDDDDDEISDCDSVLLDADLDANDGDITVDEELDNRDLNSIGEIYSSPNKRMTGAVVKDNVVRKYKNKNKNNEAEENENGIVRVSHENNVNQIDVEEGDSSSDDTVQFESVVKVLNNDGDDHVERGVMLSTTDVDEVSGRIVHDDDDDDDDNGDNAKANEINEINDAIMPIEGDVEEVPIIIVSSPASLDTSSSIIEDNMNQSRESSSLKPPNTNTNTNTNSKPTKQRSKQKLLPRHTHTSLSSDDGIPPPPLSEGGIPPPPPPHYLDFDEVGVGVGSSGYYRSTGSTIAKATATATATATGDSVLASVGVEKEKEIETVENVGTNSNSGVSGLDDDVNESRNEELISEESNDNINIKNEVSVSPVAHDNENETSASASPSASTSPSSSSSPLHKTLPSPTTPNQDKTTTIADSHRRHSLTSESTPTSHINGHNRSVEELASASKLYKGLTVFEPDIKGEGVIGTDDERGVNDSGSGDLAGSSFGDADDRIHRATSASASASPGQSVTRGQGQGQGQEQGHGESQARKMERSGGRSPLSLSSSSSSTTPIVRSDIIRMDHISISPAVTTTETETETSINPPLPPSIQEFNQALNHARTMQKELLNAHCKIERITGENRSLSGEVKRMKLHIEGVSDNSKDDDNGSDVNVNGNSNDEVEIELELRKVINDAEIREREVLDQVTSLELQLSSSQQTINIRGLQIAEMNTNEESLISEINDLNSLIKTLSKAQVDSSTLESRLSNEVVAKDQQIVQLNNAIDVEQANNEYLKSTLLNFKSDQEEIMVDMEGKSGMEHREVLRLRGELESFKLKYGDLRGVKKELEGKVKKSERINGMLTTKHDKEIYHNKLSYSATNATLNTTISSNKKLKEQLRDVTLSRTATVGQLKDAMCKHNDLKSKHDEVTLKNSKLGAILNSYKSTELARVRKYDDDVNVLNEQVEGWKRKVLTGLKDRDNVAVGVLERVLIKLGGNSSNGGVGDIENRSTKTSNLSATSSSSSFFDFPSSSSPPGKDTSTRTTKMMTLQSTLQTPLLSQSSKLLPSKCKSLADRIETALDAYVDSLRHGNNNNSNSSIDGSDGGRVSPVYKNTYSSQFNNTSNVNVDSSVNVSLKQVPVVSNFTSNAIPLRALNESNVNSSISANTTTNIQTSKFNSNTNKNGSEIDRKFSTSTTSKNRNDHVPHEWGKLRDFYGYSSLQTGVSDETVNKVKSNGNEKKSSDKDYSTTTTSTTTAVKANVQSSTMTTTTPAITPPKNNMRAPIASSSVILSSPMNPFDSYDYLASASNYNDNGEGGIDDEGDDVRKGDVDEELEGFKVNESLCGSNNDIILRDVLSESLNSNGSLNPFI